MTISIGDRLPQATFKETTSDGLEEVTTADVFGGKKVVLFAVPGAFTPTCSMNHLPGFLDNRDAILAKGVDEIAVVAVNDVFVMGAWAKTTGGEGRIRFLSDGAASFTKAIGMDDDLTERGLGVRSKRYAAIIEDGVVKTLNVEDAPGKAEVSSATGILQAL